MYLGCGVWGAGRVRGRMWGRVGMARPPTQAGVPVVAVQHRGIDGGVDVSGNLDGHTPGVLSLQQHLHAEGGG